MEAAITTTTAATDNPRPTASPVSAPSPGRAVVSRVDTCDVLGVDS